MRSSPRQPAHTWARLTALVFGLLLVRGALAQARVELEVQTTRPYAGQPFWVKVRVHDAKKVQAPDFRSLPNCEVEYVGPESRTHLSIVNNRQQLTIEKAYQYVLVPRKVGELIIPAIPVVADGKTLRTEPRRLMVREVPQSPAPPSDRRGAADDLTGDLLLAEITCKQSRLHVGQRAGFTLTIWIKPAEYGGRPLTRSDMWQCLTGTLGPFGSSKVQAIERPPADRLSEYYVYEVSTELVVRQAGPPSFSDVAVGMNYPTDFTRDLFGELRVARQRKVPRMHPVIRVPDVQPLPAEGRPADFSGAVGTYSLSVIALPTNVRVGDPIELTIDITGDLVETLPAPDLTAIPELVENFRVPGETLAGTVSGNRKRFTQSIRAKRADVKRIPPIEFAYFDPQAERYVVARSEPIPILVSAVEQLDAADLSGIAAEPSQQPNGTLELRDALRGNKTRESELLARVPALTMTPLVLTMVVPPIVFACLWAVAAVARSGRDAAIQRRRGALRAAERRIHQAVAKKLPPGQFHSEIAAAFAGYLADRLNDPPARFVGREALTLLRERDVDPELLSRCEELLQRCEQAAYAGGSDGDVSLADLARQCARQLEREQL